MFFWFIGTAVVIIWWVFRDPRFDYRLLVVGAVLPGVIDVWSGGAWVMHSLVTSVALLVVVMLGTIGRRPLRKTLLGLPLGTLLHLVVTGAWTEARVFWWPLGGWSFGDQPLPIVERGWWNLPLEAVGVALVIWVWRTAGLGDPERRQWFWRTGQLLLPSRPG